jgi:hypothetical protein
MNQKLNCPKYKVDCERNIIFKKYDREKSHLVRLDFNIDILPKEKGYFYPDKDGNKCEDIYYIDMSTVEFVIYNEDLKMCGNYDYNKEELHYYKLPLNERKCINNLDKKQIKKNERKDLISLDKTSINKDNNPKVDKNNNEYEEDIMLKIALFESLNDLKKDKESITVNLTENKIENIMLNTREIVSSNYENISLSGIKAEERAIKHNSKYNKQKNIEKEIIFQDDEMRKLLT